MPLLSGADAELVFGSLPLLSPGFSDADYEIEALGEGTDWGNPEAVIASVASMLMDGDKARINRYGNREATVPVQVRGATLDVVAEGEAAVMAEVNKGRNILTWTPPGMTTPSVYDVVYSVLSSNFLDLDELRVTRGFTLKLECLPFPRRAELTTVVATPIPNTTPTWTTIDNCNSLAGWSAPYSSAVEQYDGAIRASTPLASGGYVWMVRTGLSQAVTPGEYVVVEFAMSPPISGMPNFYLNGAGTGTPIVAVDPIDHSRARYYLEVPAGMTTLTGVTVIVWAYQPVNGPWVLVTDISKVDQLPFAGSRRQRSFTAAIGGTARTSADLIVEAEAALGGDVLVYTEPVGGFPPPLRARLVSSSTVTADSAMVSGGRQTLTTPTVYEIPAGMLNGTYSIVAMVSRTTGSAAETIGWAATTDSTLATSATNVSGSTSVTLTTTWQPVEIGVATLPTVAVDTTSTANVELTITGSATVRLDEVWLFRVTDDGSAELSWFTSLDAGSVDPSKVEVRSASLDSPRPAWVAGIAGSDADNISVADRMMSPGKHQCPPGLLNIFVVTPNVTAQTVTVEAYERSMHNVAALAV